MPHRIRLSIALCASMLANGLATAGGSAAASPVRPASPTAHVARVCGLNLALDEPASLRGGYYTGLVVKGVGCATGRRVEAAWQNCRLKHGLGGRCRSSVVGYSCHEARPKTIPTQITARVSCHQGRKTVVYNYQQNLQ